MIESLDSLVLRYQHVYFDSPAEFSLVSSFADKICFVLVEQLPFPFPFPISIGQSFVSRIQSLVLRSLFF